MGHNEDGAIIDIYTTYLIHARINGTSGEMEEFTALCYPGELCGNAFGYNLKTRLITTVNAVFPKKIVSSAIRKFCYA